MIRIHWVKLSEVKPPDEEFVLIWVPSRPWTHTSQTVFAKVAARYTEGQSGWKGFGPDYYSDFEITHWARIQPPQEDPS